MRVVEEWMGGWEERLKWGKGGNEIQTLGMKKAHKGERMLGMRS